jgi:hypothetical protein
MLGVYYRSGNSLSEVEQEIAVVLMVAKWGAAFAISEHERIAEGTSGYSKAAIPNDEVEQMIVGLRAFRRLSPAGCLRSGDSLDPITLRLKGTARLRGQKARR